MNTKENFWNVYCFVINQMRDETAKDNHQTAAWSSHDLTRNNELAVSSSTNLHVCRYQMLNVFFFYFSKKKYYFLKKKTNYRTDLKRVYLVKIYNGTSLFHSSGEGFSATKKYGSKITDHSPLV